MSEREWRPRFEQLPRTYEEVFRQALKRRGIKPPPPFHPFCNACGWRRGGVDSWDGLRCKCGFSEQPIKMIEQ